ncbi:MAG: polysaccharide biosynthesis/export family protein [Paludibacteraceae bacterium]|nr:polysaccharide biosynthesis/export family protein [Paludibacteraceae bacterium]
MHFTRYIYLFAMLVAFCLSSCITSRKVNYMQEPGKRIPAYVDTLSFEEYELKKGDRLYVQVYSIDEKMTSMFNGGMNQNNMRQRFANGGGGATADLYSYMIDDNGNIEYPHVGLLNVEGKTTREVKAMLEEKLSELIVQYGSSSNISVDVQVVMRFFSLIGVRQAGRYQITKEKETVFEALAKIGDLDDLSDKHRIHIIREVDDSTIVKTFDVRSKDIINSEYYYIEPNDVIYVQKVKGASAAVSHVSGALSITASTISFGVFVYALVDRFIVQPVKNKKNKNTDNTQQ